MSGAVPLGPLYAFITWTRKIVPLYVTICLEVLRTTTLFIHRPVCVLCSVHATYPAHPRRLHVSPEVHFLQAQRLCQPGSDVKQYFIQFYVVPCITGRGTQRCTAVLITCA